MMQYRGSKYPQSSIGLDLCRDLGVGHVVHIEVIDNATMEAKKPGTLRISTRQKSLVALLFR